MSILLDALKKSEEQRQLGTAPDIHGPGDHKPEETRYGAPAWLPGAMMAVAVIGWLVWGQFREPETSMVSGTPEVSQRSTAEPGESPVAAQQPTQARRTPVESFTAEPAGTGAEQAPDRQADAQADERRRELALTFEQFQEPQENGAANENTPEARTGQNVQPPPTGQPVASDPRQGAARPLTPHVAEPVSYWELPQNVRDDMPEFNISVMVFAEEPADRFMLINGIRLKEKESLDSVELEEIRRNGAVFRYRNYRFLIKG